MSTTTDTATFNLAFRPDSYWDPADAETAILAGVTGELRRQMVRDFVRGEAPAALGEIGDHYLADTLSEADRISLGRVHPHFMGGEYLPPFLHGEVVIARIVLQSVTMDVYSIRARRRRGLIRYRMVDEYGTDFELERKFSVAPLTLRQLIHLVDTASCLDYTNIPIAVREMNLEGGAEIDSMESFVSVNSLFYPELERYYDQQAHEWAEEKRREMAEDE